MKGVYSYQEEQTIQFDKLAQEGLFGIFGAVGSGKSTLIESIAYAIYGETERLNNRENRAYNMMNLKSKEMTIRFECMAGHNNEQLYLFSVRNYVIGKKNEQIRCERAHYRWENGQWVPTEEKPEDIIGLSYTNFQRTIIIPQGKFSEFLHMGSTERTAALMEIFQLEKYDLDDKARKLQERNRLELQSIQGQMAGLADATEEARLEIRTNLDILLEQETQLDVEFKSATQQEKELAGLKNLFNQIKEVEAQLKVLETEEVAYRDREKTLQQYEICVRLFKDLIERKEVAEEKHKQYEAGLLQLENKYKESTAKLHSEKRNHELLVAEVQQKDEKLAKARSYRRLAEWQQVETERQQLQASEEKGLVFVKDCEAEIGSLRDSVTLVQEQLTAINGTMPDIAELAEVQQWFSGKKVLAETLSTHQHSMQEVQQQADTLLQKSTHWFEQNGINKIVPQFNTNALTEAAEDILKQQRDRLLQEQQEVEKEWDRAQVEKALEQYAQNLQPGEPCPLCGATDHPRMEHERRQDNGLDMLLQRKQKIQEHIHLLEQAVREIRNKQEREKELQDALQKVKQLWGEKQHEIQLHQKLWTWPLPYQADDENSVKAVQNQLKLKQQEIAAKEAERKTMQEKLDKKLQSKDNALLKLNAISQKIAVLAEKSRNLLADVQQQDMATQRTAGQLTAAAEEVERSVNETEILYQKAEQLVQQLNQEAANLSGHIEAGKQHLQEAKQHLEDIQASFTQRLAESDFTSQEEVQLQLSNRLDIEQEHAVIRQYWSRRDSCKIQLGNLEAQKNNQHYDENLHQTLLARIQQWDTELKHLREESGRRKQALKHIEEQLKRKKELDTQLQELQKKDENLQTIRNLFRSRGFVNYVSTMYLQNLCHAANERFRKLTRQSLSLELNENNQFQVRDFLNEGKTRHIKTLSGGQTFQAALSLALALADNTQKLASRKQNFFFIDEGFGSLDKESLRIVMDTLKMLRKENRIVGIISHVEELQQEMDVFLSISQSEDKGSTITYSWAD